MFISSDLPEIKLLLHKALNLVEAIDLENCDCPRAKAIVITKIEEALLWLDYPGRSAPTEGQREKYHQMKRDFNDGFDKLPE